MTSHLPQDITYFGYEAVSARGAGCRDGSCVAASDGSGDKA
jgi:hypothetical protein